MSLTVRENAAVSALERFKRGPLLSRRTGGRRASARAGVARGQDAVAGAAGLGAVRRQPAEGRAGPGPAVRSRRILVADEPTQGVDVGARAEIYRILREVSDERRPGGRRAPPTPRSSRASATACSSCRAARSSTSSTGDDVTEERLINAAVRATGHTRQASGRAARRPGSPARAASSRATTRRSLILALVMLALGAYIFAPERPLPVGVQHHVGA